MMKTQKIQSWNYKQFWARGVLLAFFLQKITKEMIKVVCLRQVKNYLNIYTSSEDEFIKELMGYSIGLIENYCGRTFNLEIRNDLVKGNGRAFISTPVFPLREIISLTINGQIVDSKDYSIRNKMVFYPKYFPVDYLEYNNNHTPNAYKRGYNIEIEYKTGYAFPRFEDAVNESDVPKELQFATLELIKYAYVQSGVQAQEQTKTYSTVGESVSKQYFKNDKVDIPAVVKKILDKYKKGIGGM